MMQGQPKTSTADETDFEALSTDNDNSVSGKNTRTCGDCLPQMLQLLWQAIHRCKEVDEVIFCYPGLEAVTIYRVAHELYRLQVPFIPRMLTEWAHREDGYRYPSGCPNPRALFY